MLQRQINLINIGCIKTPDKIDLIVFNKMSDLLSNFDIAIQFNARDFTYFDDDMYENMYNYRDDDPYYEYLSSKEQRCDSDRFGSSDGGW
jgi:hypothetical protein